MKIDIRAYDAATHGEMRGYDYSTLNAVNQCPTYAVLRYGLGKVWSKSERSMALEAGQACHDVFAAARVWRLFNQGEQSHAAHGLRRGRELFGEVRWERMLPLLRTSDDRNDYLRFCLEALATSGFYDDPSDRRRTYSNLEQSCIAYLDAVDTRSPIWIADPLSDSSDVGIELPFDLVVSIDERRFRFIGRIDGLHTHYETGELWIQENKTASRLDLSWRESFRMSHQITGYMLAASHIAQGIVRHGLLLGTAIPQPRSSDYGGVCQEVVTRNDVQFAQWATWAKHTIDIFEGCRNNPVDSPKYTGSCNKYFRSCSYIPYCAADYDDKVDIIGFMEEDKWSPLDEKTGD